VGARCPDGLAVGDAISLPDSGSVWPARRVKSFVVVARVCAGDHVGVRNAAVRGGDAQDAVSGEVSSLGE